MAFVHERCGPCGGSVRVDADDPTLAVSTWRSKHLRPARDEATGQVDTGSMVDRTEPMHLVPVPGFIPLPPQ